MRLLSRGLAKKVFAILGLLAVSAALAQPLCSPDRNQPETSHHEDCYVSLTSSALAGPATEVAPGFKPQAALPPPGAAVAGRRSVQARIVRAPPDVAPVSLSYHVRSARIQR